MVFRGNLDVKDSKRISKYVSPFLNETIEIWSESKFHGTIESVDSFLAQSLWNNSLIRVMDKPAFEFFFSKNNS